MPSSHLSAIVIGAGNRGTNYSLYAKDYPEKLKIVAIAEPKSFPRERLRKLFNIPSELCFSDWTDIIKLGKIADIAIIATNDTLHKDPAIAAARLKYHILLEKPMAVTVKDCIEIEKVCRENEVILAVCHVLRYLPPVLAIKKCIEDGVIGEVVNIQHAEHVGFWHFAHSFVRGNWRNSEESSFSLMTKCGHDVDLIKYWMGDKKCKKISSFGSLYHFQGKNKPKNSGKNCLECDIEDTCPYSAKKIYLDTFKNGNDVRWPHSVVCEPGENFKERLEEKLLNGPYGRCVYSCDNDVCDNQTVQFQYEDGSTATLTMIAFTKKLCERDTKIFGTKGELSWDGNAEGPVVHFDFLTRETKNLALDYVENGFGSLKGHGGADFYLMNSFINSIAQKQESIYTDAADALESHLLVFAAEESRIKNEIIDYEKYKSNLK